MRTTVRTRGALVATILTTALTVVGCGGGGGNDKASGAKGGASQAVTMPKTFNDPPGADPSVADSMGGNGFEKLAAAQGWSTGNIAPDQLELIGDKNAKKGGQVRVAIGDFPATFRIFGKDAGTTTNQRIYSLVYETLIGINPMNLEFLPGLATHWKIDPVDSQTYWFRINPNARFSDGHAVTTEDVIATWRLGDDEKILDPFQNTFQAEFDDPVAVSKYILKVRSKINNWKNMLYFGGQQIYPAHVVGKLGGEEFLKKFQTEMPPGSGPYVMLTDGLQKQKSITLTRRADWWAKDDPLAVGQYNFDKIKFVYVEDENLQFERFRAGETDIYLAGRSQWWKQKFDFDEVKRGLIQKRKIWNDKPNSIIGLAFNMRRPPFNDPKVRQAVVLLLNREEYIKKILLNERLMQDSYFPNSPYENPNNPKYRYDPARAQQLLTEAGYTTRNSEGVLVKNGQPFEIEVPIGQGDEIIMGPIQQDLRKAGIKVNFRTVDFAQKIKLQDERNFSMVQVAYSGIIYPNPEGQFSSKLADKTNNQNLTGFKNPRVDEIIAIEKVTADPKKRIPLLQELDSILMATNAYALLWFSPFERYAAWSYIAMPKFGWSRIGDYRDAYVYWWYDADIKKQVDEAKKDKSIKLPVPPVDNRFWLDWDKQHGAGATASVAPPLRRDARLTAR
ncbi:MAG TPA: extracellular solute-binding protein [Candidatus Kapabacteria bacterium]|nr:extracellular solute-binding protein [Candidatus Kapabacteria bacterium]